ncbi:hypothetical protein AVEN_244371-1, partial [Araneus ventricosus]
GQREMAAALPILSPTVTTCAGLWFLSMFITPVRPQPTPEGAGLPTG